MGYEASDGTRTATWEDRSVIARSPTGFETIPAALASVIGPRPYEVIWCNEVGGVTVRLGDARTGRYLKWAPAGSEEELLDEVRRLAWASRYTPVPQVVDTGVDDGGSWFETVAIDGESAVAPRWRREPAAAAAALGRGLRDLHDGLDAESCPFAWSAAQRLATVELRLDRGQLEGFEFEWEFAGYVVNDALEEVRRVPDEDLVVCHGDACAPNTILDASGRWLAHVDLGRLGVADRWADLAVAAWSARWNYGPGWEDAVYEAYGVSADAPKIRYYRLLWALE